MARRRIGNATLSPTRPERSVRRPPAGSTAPARRARRLGRRGLRRRVSRPRRSAPSSRRASPTSPSARSTSARWRSSGLRRATCARQIPRALAALPDVVRDHHRRQRRDPPGPSRRRRCATCTTPSSHLRSARTQVVVGTCPDLGTVRPIAPPLRQVARRVESPAGRGADHRRRRGRTAGRCRSARSSDRSSRRRPADMFGPDGFHPSPAGYKACAGRDAALGRGGRRRAAGGRERARAARAARASTPCPRPPPRPPSTPAPRSLARPQDAAGVRPGRLGRCCVAGVATRSRGGRRSEARPVRMLSRRSGPADRRCGRDATADSASDAPTE